MVVVVVVVIVVVEVVVVVVVVVVAFMLPLWKFISFPLSAQSGTVVAGPAGPDDAEFVHKYLNFDTREDDSGNFVFFSLSHVVVNVCMYVDVRGVKLIIITKAYVI